VAELQRMMRNGNRRRPLLALRARESLLRGQRHRGCGMVEQTREERKQASTPIGTSRRSSNLGWSPRFSVLPAAR